MNNYTVHFSRLTEETYIYKADSKAEAKERFDRDMELEQGEIIKVHITKEEN